MNLKSMKDAELLTQTKALVQREREVLTRVLHHLREVERRKLFSELGYKSLFDYAVNELKYSEGQAGRRIQAMRMIKELPEVEQKIASGSLSLTNVSQAQSFFREVKKSQPQKSMPPQERADVLQQLENKSAREGQKILLNMQPSKPLPREKERLITATHTEVRFVMDEDLKSKLEEVRSLLGPKATLMSLSELISEMATLSCESLKIKKFGKKRVVKREDQPSESTEPNAKREEVKVSKPTKLAKNGVEPANSIPTNNGATQDPAPELSEGQLVASKSEGSIQARATSRAKCPRYISKSIQHKVWLRDQGRCTGCGSWSNLNFDHIKPVALGGGSDPENLRLLCFHCNQRQAIKTFGPMSFRTTSMNPD